MLQDFDSESDEECESVPLNIPTVFQASDMLDQLKTFSLEKGHASMLTTLQMENFCVNIHAVF